MTTTLAHPPAEELGRFIEGTLDDAGRAVVVEHIADCDECRIVVVDSTEFSEQSVPAVPARRVANGRWMAIAASIIVVVGAGLLVIKERQYPLAGAIKAASGVSSRPIEARLNGFPYAPKITNRGEAETDPTTLPLEIEVLKLLDLRGSDAKTLHAVGVANLIEVSFVRVDAQANEEARKEASDRIKWYRAKALQNLRAASAAAPDNYQYKSDLAAALIEIPDSGNLDLAIAQCDQAIHINRNFPDAWFNRAKALELLGRTSDAIKAYDSYLAIDSSSPWATEALDHRKRLQELSPP
ncbi:MAG: Tetratricopeptide repeat [Thermoanaerobaculia bacterium]|jgi:hypothetical protein|nr:Tetratricopeptide repeat [Thermoanaerobaculia bacterium]